MKYGQLCETTSDADFPTFIANTRANAEEEDDVRPCNAAAYCLVFAHTEACLWTFVSIDRRLLIPAWIWFE